MEKTVGTVASSPETGTSLPSTPSFTTKFQDNFQSLDLRKLTFTQGNCSQRGGVPDEEVESPPPSTVDSKPDQTRSLQSLKESSVVSGGSVRNSPTSQKRHILGHSYSQDSLFSARHTFRHLSTQARLRESLLKSLNRIPHRTKDIEFQIPMVQNSVNTKNSSGESSEVNSPTLYKGAFGLINPELYKSKEEEEEPEDLGGGDDNTKARIQYILEYENSTERLIVSLITLKNIKAQIVKKNAAVSSSPTSTSFASTSSTSPTSTCLVRVTLFPDEKRKLTTKPKLVSSQIIFEENHIFHVSNSSLNDRTLKFCVFDIDDNNKQRELGYVVQPLKLIDLNHGKQTLKENLQPENIEANLGEVLISLCYNQLIARLTLTISEAKGIQLNESSSGAYAKILLMNNTKIVKSKRTSTNQINEEDGSISFNESYGFKVPEIDTTSISVQIVNALPGFNRDQPIGRIIFGSSMFAKGSGKEQWLEMLSKNKISIKMWQSLTNKSE